MNTQLGLFEVAPETLREAVGVYRASRQAHAERAGRNPAEAIYWPTCHICRAPIDRCTLIATIQLCDRCEGRRMARLSLEMRG